MSLPALVLPSGVSVRPLLCLEDFRFKKWKILGSPIPGHASMFDLSQLRCFVTVAEELHFGKATARLNMTQPLLSRQIQVLEHITDAPLLERASPSVRLTPAGRSFLPEAKRILKLAESASQVARRVAMGKTGSLKIGCTATAVYGILPELIAPCRARLPEVDFSLKELMSGDQLEALASGEIDARLLRPPIARAEFATKRVVAEPLLAAIPGNRPLASADTVSIKVFDDQPFVMYSHYELFPRSARRTVHARGHFAPLRPAPQRDPLHSGDGARRPGRLHRACRRHKPQDRRRDVPPLQAAHADTNRIVHGLSALSPEPVAAVADRNCG